MGLFGKLTRIAAFSAGRIASNAVYYGSRKRRSGAPSKNRLRIQREHQELLYLAKAWIWFGQQITGRNVSLSINAEFKSLEKDFVDTLNAWDETKRYRRIIETLNCRFAKLALDFGLLDSLQSYVNSLAAQTA